MKKCLAEEIKLSLSLDYRPECSDLKAQSLPPVLNLMFIPSEISEDQTMKIASEEVGAILVNIINETN